ncbi:MAG: magnesium/cobalt transporter CorA [Bacteroidetes bacterium]|nr:magnesium/cobalt transporter CorA [Bacteroidota bacterium]
MGKAEKKLCQLYKYDREFYLKTTNEPAYFASEFVKTELNPEVVSWLNFHSIKYTSEISSLLGSLGVDNLVVEDVYADKQRPKIEEYDGYIFFSIRSALPPTKPGGDLTQEQISFVLGDTYVISLQQKKSDHFTEVRQRIEMPKGQIRIKGADFLLYRMLEAVVDNYYEVLDDITSKTEKMEAIVLKNTHAQTLQFIENEKRRLADLRRIALPMRDISSQIEKSNNPLFDPVNKAYFLDLKDHCLGVLDEIDTTKQILEGMTNLYYAVQGQRMNEIMKVLTVISAIFIPLTFMAGIYGMNFDNIPELHSRYGYFVLLGAMLVIAVILVFYFRRKGWLT